MKEATITLTLIEAMALIKILEWTNEQENFKNLSKGDINFLGLSETIIKKLNNSII